MATVEETSKEEREGESGEIKAACPGSAGGSGPGRIEPDLDFIQAVIRQGGDTFKKCIQCGTCSATCALSPDRLPFPRKEMAWALFGMKESLLNDPDIWLCYHCNDCSTRCPRGAKPGDVMAAVRQECVQHYAIPRFFGRWVNEPACIPLLLGIPAALLTVALVAREPLENALGITKSVDEKIVFAYSHMFPHWLLNTLFGFFTLLAVVAVFAGAMRYWRALKATLPSVGNPSPARGARSSFAAVVKRVFTHEGFSDCISARPRHVAHVCVFFGFIALTLVTLWVITARYNPLIRDDFTYPFGFWNPWKMLANAGGAALLIGLGVMFVERLKEKEQEGSGTYFDWALIVALLLVVITGFVTELLHYLRLEPHRHIAYFAHLVFVFAVLVYLPYSKLAHLAYRFTALVFAEYSGRKAGEAAVPGELKGRDRNEEEKDDV